jgi:hypothetical protein
VFRGVPQDPKGFYAAAAEKGEQLRVWFQGLGDGVQDVIESQGNAGGGGALPPGDDAQAEASLDAVPVSGESNVAYDRDQWKHWNNVRSCWTVREEVIARQAEKGTLKLLDADKQPTTNLGKACSITSGSWKDPYTGSVITDPGALDVDHMVPLGEAAKSGGQGWDTARKEKYANALTPGHLVAVSATANRAKGDKDPGEWKPSNRAVWCAYASSWINVKSTWGLSVDAAEKKALNSMLQACPTS